MILRIILLVLGASTEVLIRELGVLIEKSHSSILTAGSSSVSVHSKIQIPSITVHGACDFSSQSNAFVRGLINEKGIKIHSLTSHQYKSVINTILIELIQKANAQLVAFYNQMIGEEQNQFGLNVTETVAQDLAVCDTEGFNCQFIKHPIVTECIDNQCPHANDVCCSKNGSSAQCPKVAQDLVQEGPDSQCVRFVSATHNSSSRSRRSVRQYWEKFGIFTGHYTDYIADQAKKERENMRNSVYGNLTTIQRSVNANHAAIEAVQSQMSAKFCELQGNFESQMLQLYADQVITTMKSTVRHSLETCSRGEIPLETVPLRQLKQWCYDLYQSESACAHPLSFVKCRNKRVYRSLDNKSIVHQLTLHFSKPLSNFLPYRVTVVPVPISKVGDQSRYMQLQLPSEIWYFKGQKNAPSFAFEKCIQHHDIVQCQYGGQGMLTQQSSCIDAVFQSDIELVKSTCKRTEFIAQNCVVRTTGTVAVISSTETVKVPSKSTENIHVTSGTSKCSGICTLELDSDTNFICGGVMYSINKLVDSFNTTVSVFPDLDISFTNVSISSIPHVTQKMTRMTNINFSVGSGALLVSILVFFTVIAVYSHVRRSFDLLRFDRSPESNPETSSEPAVKPVIEHESSEIGAQ